jgi:hypothetical protein
VILKIDEVSSRTVGRFVAKLALALVLAALAWLSVLAWFTAILAVMRRYRFDPDPFTSWDEVLWLMFLAHGLRLAHMATA